MIRNDVATVITALRAKVRRMLKHPLASNSVWLATSQYIATGVGVLNSIVAARLLGPANYGTVALVMAYPTLLWSFVGIKSVSVTTRYIADFRATGQNEKLRGIVKLGYGLDFFVSVVAFVLVGATSWWVARSIYGMAHLSWLMVGYAASFPFFSLSATSWAILSSRQRFRWLAGLQILQKVITFIITLSLLVAGFGAPGVILGITLGRIITGLTRMGAATYALSRDEVGPWWSASINNVAPLRKELTAFFGWNYLVVTLSGLIEQVPLMLLGRLRSPEEAGFYRLATSLVTVGSYMESSLGKVTYPILSARWGAGERESIKGTLKRWTLQGGLLAGALMLLAIPFLPIVVPIAFGSGYSPMIPSAQVMMVGAAVSSVFFWLNSFYYSSGRINLWAKAYGLYTSFIIGLGWLVIQRWGFFGLAGLVVVGKVLFTLGMVILTYKVTRDLE